MFAMKQGSTTIEFRDELLSVINSFVFFSGIVILIHVFLMYSLISYLRYNTVTGWEYTSLFYINHRYCHSKNCQIYMTGVWIIVFYSHRTYLLLPFRKYFNSIQIFFADSDLKFTGGTHAIFTNLCDNGTYIFDMSPFVWHLTQFFWRDNIRIHRVGLIDKFWGFLHINLFSEEALW